MTVVPESGSKRSFESVRHCRVAPIALMAWLFMCAHAEGRIIINEVNMGSQDYFEIYNYDTNPIDLTGYTAEFWDSGLGALNPIPVIGFPNLTLAANSLLTFHENANVGAGEIDTPPQYMFHGRDLSIVIRNSSGDIVDLWAHGNSFFGPPDADPGTVPVNTISSNGNGTTYQRFVVQNGNGFAAGDWGAATATRNAVNSPQVVAVVAVPEPESWLLCLTGVTVLCGTWYYRGWTPHTIVTEQA